MADYLIKGETLTGIADAIRGSTGKTEQIKAEDMAAEVGEVFEAGKKSEYDDFWDAFQNNGERVQYRFTFSGRGWNHKNFYPKYSMRPTQCQNMFAYWEDSDGEIFDFAERLTECGVEFDLSNSTNVGSLFSSNLKISHVGVIDISNATSCGAVFAYAMNLVTIDLLKFPEGKEINLSNFFERCYALENLTIGSAIMSNGLSVQWSERLTHDSLMSIINALADYSKDTSGTTWTVTLGETNRAKLTDDELAIAEMKGWEIA